MKRLESASYKTWKDICLNIKLPDTPPKSEEQGQEYSVYQFLANLCKLNICPIVIFFLALVIVTKAIIQDSSIIDYGENCKSELLVKIIGTGQGTTKSLARINCRNSCKQGADNFKRRRCPNLCGIPVRPIPVKCFLCYPNKDYWISV